MKAEFFGAPMDLSVMSTWIGLEEQALLMAAMLLALFQIIKLTVKIKYATQY